MTYSPFLLVFWFRIFFIDLMRCADVHEMLFLFSDKNVYGFVNIYIFAELYIFKLSYIFLAKQEISEAYTNVPAKTHDNYFISMSVCPNSFCLAVCLSICGTILCTVV